MTTTQRVPTKQRVALRIAAWTGVGAIALGALASFAEARSPAAGPDVAAPPGVTLPAAVTAPDAAPAPDRAAPTETRREAQASPSPSQRPNRERARERKHRDGRFRHILHGEFTVQTRDGFQVRFVQRGEVTEVTATSITVRSPDGYTKTYQVTAETKVRKNGEPATIADVKVGDRAHVAGTKDGDAYVLRGIAARTPEASTTNRG